VSFVSANIVSDPDTLLDSAIDSVNANLETAGYPGWTANDASLSVIILAAVAQLAADDANVAATVLPAIFRAYGTLLCGIPYQQGAYATVLSTWTFSAPAPAGGYLIGAGTVVIIDGTAFQTQTPYTSNAGDTSAVILLIAATLGSASNGLGGIGEPVQANQQIDWVSGIVTQTVTSGGADQQTDDAYDANLTSTLTLQRLSIVNASDYPPALMSDVCEQATGVAVGRATAIDEYWPSPRATSTISASVTVPCAITSGSAAMTFQTALVQQAPEVGAAVTGTGIPSGTTVAALPAPSAVGFTLSAPATASATNTLTIAALTGYEPAYLTCTASFGSGATALTVTAPPYTGSVPTVGAAVYGTNIPAGATVAASPAPTSTTFSISTGTTAASSGETVTIAGWTSVERCVTSFVTDVNGNALSAADMDALETWLASYREVSFDPFVEPPSYSTIYVNCEIAVLPGYDPSSAAAGAQAAIIAYLSPATWGNPGAVSTGQSTWLNSGDGFNVVRVNSLIGRVENVPAVAYVPNGGLQLGFTASPTGTVDLVMPGPAPLPQSSASTVLVQIAS
jgi:hypothetical protein